MNVDHGGQVVSERVRLTQGEYGAFVLRAAFLTADLGAMAILGDGSAVQGTPRALAGGAGRRVSLGAVAICAHADVDKKAMLCGTEDGRLVRVSPDGAVATIWTGKPGWVEQLAVHARSGLRAVAQGRAVVVLGADGVPLAHLDDHPSTPTGLSFSPNGSKIAVSHYGGISVWQVVTGEKTHGLSWHGSHTGVSWSPDGRFIVSAMQDKELHCWRMPAAKGMRMSGYPSKIRALSWTADAAYLVAGGADTVTSWYCAEGGPAGRAPLEFGYVFNGTVTAVAAHPTDRRAAGGYNEGTVLIGELETGDAIIARPPGGGAVTTLSWSEDGASLIAGTERGAVALIELAGGEAV